MSEQASHYWESKSLEELNQQEWESLCDRCGLCCLVRVQDEESLVVYDTTVVCKHYNCTKKQCSSYTSRTELSDGCVALTPELVREYNWLPNSCAYRVVMRGEPLPETHHLLSGNTDQTPTVVDIFEPMGLVVNGPDVEPENYLIAKSDLKLEF